MVEQPSPSPQPPFDWLPRTIVSGGQIGVDRAALDWASGHRIAHGGWCQKGRLAADEQLALYYRLCETESDRGQRMHESAEFLRSLEHDNPCRPRFRIKPAMVTELEIQFKGKTFSLPIAEVLEFAHRWSVDHEVQSAVSTPVPRLRIFPYPLYDVRLTDPDVAHVVAEWAGQIGTADTEPAD